MDINYARNLLEKTRQDYDLIAEDFSRTRKEIWPELGFLFENYLTSGEKVLDLGCGNGRWFKLFQKKGVDYFGVDNSEKLIEIAKKLYPRATFQLGDILSLPFPDDFFDKIYNIAVLHHLPSDEFRTQSLTEIKRILKPKGRLVLTVWKFHRSKERCLLFKYTILKLIGKSKLDWKDFFEPWDKKIKRYYHFFSKSELINLVKSVDFKVQAAGSVKNERGSRQNIYLIAEK